MFNVMFAIKQRTKKNNGKCEKSPTSTNPTYYTLLLSLPIDVTAFCM